MVYLSLDCVRRFVISISTSPVQEDLIMLVILSRFYNHWYNDLSKKSVTQIHIFQKTFFSD